jgi:hypothetical protein
MLGGMIGPRIAAPAVMTAASSGLYPSRSMAGISMPPTAAAEAAAEPEMVAKSRLVKIVTWPRPPRRWPTSDCDRPIRAPVMPPTFITAPARMKSGMASSGKESSEE